MATPRLPFLWPAFFRHTSRSSVLASFADVVAPRTAHRPAPRARFSYSARRRDQPSTSSRYGTANEPPPQSKKKEEAAASGNPTTKASSPPNASASPSSMPSEHTQLQQDASSSRAQLPPAEEVILLQQPGKGTPEPANGPMGTPTEEHRNAQPQPATHAPNPTSADLSAPQTATAEAAGSALTSLLQMEPPMSSDANPEDKPPHLQAPPYVHHFDTFTLVRSLQGDGHWSETQAIEVMKAMRGLLTVNMELARDGLVSKGDAEMESYLFRAACSELSTEIRQRRTTAHNQMASQRAQLQHEVDILSQRIGQETGNLKDELKGMFDDRKMAVRQERRTMENRIQELNYKITIALNSEMRSEVEGLRWVITRRVVIALLAVIVGALAVLRFSKNAEAKSAADRRSHEKSSGTADGGRDDGTQTTPRELDLTSPEVMKRLDAGDSPALVSLG